MINLNKNTEAILQIQRYQKIAKESYSQRNETIITEFGIISLRILLLSNIPMEEERTWNAGKTNNWDTVLKTSANFTASYCGMSIHCWPQSASQPLETFDLYGKSKRGVEVNSPSARKKIIRWIKKGNMRFYIVHYVKWSYTNNNDVLAPIFFQVFNLRRKGEK